MSPQKPKRITLRDVAKEAGVSIQTVSHVLSGNPTVSLPESTRCKVRAAAEKVGYQPNRHAQAIRGGKTNLISVWMPVDRPIVTYMRFLKRISSLARRDGYELMVNCLQRDDALNEGGRPPTLYPVDGIVSIDSGKAIQEFRKVKGNDHIPVSILGFEQVAYGDSISWDLDGASKRAVYDLIERGARKIAHVTLDWILADFPRERRRRGYVEAMESAGLEPVLIPAAGDTSTEAAESLRAHFAKNRYDAVFCVTDTYALAVARVLTEQGLGVPADTMVIGTGNYPEAEDYAVPISTIRLDVDAVIDQSWEWLMQRIADPTIPPRMTVLDMSVVHRASTTRRDS
ncbi:MAG: LacI family DNA-binding transcriptional regulator [Armatimonadetes bacterium]|nr:LacI family DNA-binding transcriptional regulator [Armatimonadota bacterium]MBS1712363.1 LacI family DNA-binding transcriptional regulator [Armatimonadota bacterium]MBX3108071.1 LacI family DNA-binding transcriptional regulator [Fimbriimonadaceae bacterium]